MKMSDELSQGSFQRSFAEQDEFADAFLFNRADPALRKRVQVRAPRGQSQTMDSARLEHVSKSPAEFRVTVVQHIAMLAQTTRLLVHRITGHLRHPAFGGMPRQAAQGHSPGLQVQK